MNKSIIHNNEEYCYVCGQFIYGNKDKHHIFNGPYRSKSEDDGLYIYCHRVCHEWLHRHPISNRTYKLRGQKIWMLHYKKSLEEFIERYGKNYDTDK